MAEKKVEVFYQAPGKTKWERVESQEKVRGRAARRAARALLAEADAAAARLMTAARPSRSLTPEEAFERQMAAELGAWRRFMAVEVRRFGRATEAAIDELLGKKR